MASGVQNIRLRRPETTPAPPKQERHTGILQDQLRRAQRRPWSPGFSLAFRILVLVRFCAAMYSNIDDCDEVYNFWEPLHFFDRGTGFQTWETAPQYAIRSWTYVLLHLLPTRIASHLLGRDVKRPAFFAVRIFLAFICAFSEARFYRTVSVKINERVGRYLFFMLLLSAGMWNASTAFLPSSFAMYTTMLAFSYAMELPTTRNVQRTVLSTLAFATGAIVGWPFALALAIPFVYEELFLFGADQVLPQTYPTWLLKRWQRLFSAGLLASSVFVPVILIDSAAYGRWTVVPWNIVRYNIFGGADRGPELYGTSPPSYYILNLILNFNVLVPLSLLSLPAMAVTYVFDNKRLGIVRSSAHESSPFTALAVRLAPFYLWLAILSSQPHKEERFMFPAYPLLCFNAAVTLYLIRGWQEVAYIKFTKSPYKAAQTKIFSRFTLCVITISSIISISRGLALWNYYHSPMTVVYKLETDELPRLLNVTGLLPVYPPDTHEDDIPRVDLTPIRNFDLKLCVGKEWHRFPGSYLVPDGVSIEFIKSEFSGLLPGHFQDVPVNPDFPLSKIWLRPGTSLEPKDQNDLNKEELSRYIPVEQCDYLIDLDFPLHPTSSPLEPRYAKDESAWERVYCKPFLDAQHSRLLTRAFWAPGAAWQAGNEFGDYCLLKNKALVAGKESEVAKRVNKVVAS